MQRVVFSESNNVGLSSIIESDAELFYKWFNDSRIVTTMGDFDLLPFSQEDAKSYAKSHSKDTFMICIKEGDLWKPVGYTGVFTRKRHSVGIWRIAIGDSEYLGKGIAKNATYQMIRYMFEQLNLRKSIFLFPVQIIVQRDSMNQSALSILENIPKRVMRMGFFMTRY